MTKKYVLQEFMNLDYSDDLLTEEEREGNKQGIHLVFRLQIENNEKKIIVIKSTVVPGTTNGIVKNNLELFSKKKCGVGLTVRTKNKNVVRRRPNNSLQKI